MRALINIIVGSLLFSCISVSLSAYSPEGSELISRLQKKYNLKPESSENVSKPEPVEQPVLEEDVSSDNEEKNDESRVLLENIRSRVSDTNDAKQEILIQPSRKVTVEPIITIPDEQDEMDDADVTSSEPSEELPAKKIRKTENSSLAKKKSVEKKNSEEKKNTENLSDDKKEEPVKSAKPSKDEIKKEDSVESVKYNKEKLLEAKELLNKLKAQIKNENSNISTSENIKGTKNVAAAKEISNAVLPSKLPVNKTSAISEKPGDYRSFGELSDEELIKYAKENLWDKKKSKSHNPPPTLKVKASPKPPSKSSGKSSAKPTAKVSPRTAQKSSKKETVAKKTSGKKAAKNSKSDKNK
ncbi:MAG: hypothetical protein HQM10_02935 [Candidatus Riflebacteria bacterium]|nr:hypothetical protein [Candidatus Riflebacteria bacterium]